MRGIQIIRTISIPVRQYLPTKINMGQAELGRTKQIDTRTKGVSGNSTNYCL